MTKKPDRLRADYLSGSGIFGQFVFSYWEELDKTKFFLKTMEDFVADSEKDEVSALEKGLEALTPEQKDEYWQWHYPIHWQEIFSNRLRASFIMQLCSFIEGELNEISKRVEVISNAPIGVSDLRGSTLSKPKKFLQAFGRFESPSEEIWTVIERIFDVRNVMVHAAGFSGAYRDHKKIVDFATKVPGLTLQNEHIQADRLFCEYCLETVTEFCQLLHKQYESFRKTAETLARLEAR
jgi:hypothetical protein